jgi:toxin YoeB
MLKRINTLIKDIELNPFEAIDKPETLKFDLGGFWSRRIDGEHQLVYGIKEDEVHVLACRYHYVR